MIREARLTDFEAISDLGKDPAIDLNRLRSDRDYRIQVQLNGFLVSPITTIEEFKTELGKYTVAEHEGEAQGFLRLDHEHEMRPETPVFWLRPAFEHLYLSEPHADIGQVAVSPQLARRGFASKLLEKAEEQTRSLHIPYLFSFVVICPVTNFSSALFHEENGFERMAIVQPLQLFGMQDYQSVLYGKQLTQKPNG